MVELTPERQALYRKLSELVDEFNALDVEQDGDPASIPTAWALIVGFEGAQVTDPGLNPSMVGAYVKDGTQANWKTAGLLHQALSQYEYRMRH